MQENPREHDILPLSMSYDYVFILVYFFCHGLKSLINNMPTLDVYLVPFFKIQQ